ncbi:hypothetical protein GGF31_008153 [Allomyces arbusculus]|nr:hypothetical protein GGF31_008153 [Allomyces arbusculus]
MTNALFSVVALLALTALTAAEAAKVIYTTTVAPLHAPNAASYYAPCRNATVAYNPTDPVVWLSKDVGRELGGLFNEQFCKKCLTAVVNTKDNSRSIALLRVAGVYDIKGTTAGILVFPQVYEKLGGSDKSVKQQHGIDDGVDDCRAKYQCRDDHYNGREQQQQQHHTKHNLGCARDDGDDQLGQLNGQHRHADQHQRVADDEHGRDHGAGQLAHHGHQRRHNDCGRAEHRQ